MSIELQAEEKQRIDAEERKRAAEQYRAKVRADLEASGSPRRWTGVAVGLFCVVAIAAVAWLMWERKMDADRAGEAARIANRPHVQYVPVSKPMVSGQLTLKAGEVRLIRFTITPEMGEARVLGRFIAGGTNGADIEALLMSEDEFPNWDHGHQSRTLYSTNGPKTTDRFDVALDPGAYVLVFSNRAALLFHTLRDTSS